MGDRGISGFVAGRVSSRVSLVVPDHGCGREVLGRVSLRVLLGLLLGVSMVVLDRGMEWEVSRRVLGCRWWWSEGVLWKVRVLLDVAGDV